MWGKIDSEIVFFKAIVLILKIDKLLQYQIDGLKQTIKVESRLIYSSLLLIVEAAKQDLDIGYLPLNLVQEAIEKGDLVEILKDYRYTFEPYYLYYPHRREQTPLLNILVETIKARKLSK